MKGHVRDEIVNSLARAPGTLTSIASELRVSKPTVGYHLSRLLSRGVIEVVEERPGRGGNASHLYALRPGSTVFIPSVEEEARELRAIEEAFDVATLGWEGREGIPEAAELTGLLYRIFLRLFNLNRTERAGVLRSYGLRTGASLATHVEGSGTAENVRWISRELQARGIASIDVAAVPGSRLSALISGTCLGSSEHPTSACYFVEGLVAGLIQGRHGTRYEVRRVASGIPACVLLVGRPKQFGSRSLREDLLASRVRLVATAEQVNAGG